MSALESEDKGVEDESCCRNDSRLKPSTGTEISMELDVKGKKKDGRNDDLRRDAKDYLITHGPPPDSSSFFNVPLIRPSWSSQKVVTYPR